MTTPRARLSTLLLLASLFAWAASLFACASARPTLETDPVFLAPPNLHDVQAVDAQAVPPDPGGPLAKPKLLSPELRGLELELGDRVTIAPEALKAGWTLRAVEDLEVRRGVLWPVPDRPGVFFARCPGSIDARLVHPGASPAPLAGPAASALVADDAATSAVVNAPRTVTIPVKVRKGATTPAKCGPAFDPPRIVNPGSLHRDVFDSGVRLEVGESFILSNDDKLHTGAVPKTRVRFDTNDGVIRYADTTLEGARYEAVRPGIAVLHIWIESDRGAKEGVILLDVR